MEEIVKLSEAQKKFISNMKPTSSMFASKADVEQVSRGLGLFYKSTEQLAALKEIVSDFLESKAVRCDKSKKFGHARAFRTNKEIAISAIEYVMIQRGKAMFNF